MTTDRGLAIVNRHTMLLARLFKWDNSLAVRLPGAVVEALKLKAGDEIEVTVAGARRVEVVPYRGRGQALARLRKYRCRLPAGFGFDREEANARR